MSYDVTIIGAGWAGFNAALKAKELGLKVLLVDKSEIGGTCLNRGCIPTKSLIQSAKIYSLAKKSVNFGIEIPAATANFLKIQERKEKVIQQLRSGMQFMLKNIDFKNAEARIISPQEVDVGGQKISTKNILIACGSKPVELKALKFDGKKIISSDEILNLKEVPKSLLIIGGGVIGCEFASLFNIFGTKATVVEMMPQLLPGVDSELARKLEQAYKKKGIQANTNTDATTIDLSGFDLVLLCIGRAPNTQGLELDKLGVGLEKNKIIVDEYLKTNIPNIYAAGDCTGKIMLAHYASYQGVVAAQNIANPANPIKADNAAVPSCIFTDPEIACVGISEQEARNKGTEAEVHKFDFLGCGMARIMDEAEGFVKAIFDKNTKQILGASIIGPKATELISVFGLALTSRLNIAQVRETIFAHPSLSEAIGEAVKG